MSSNTVLVIDDEKDLVELIRYNLEKAGLDVIGATDGESGLEIATRHHPDVITLDLMLPGIDGLEICRRLRADPRTARIPVIMLTAKTEEADRIVGLELGADDYVTKPFSPRELLARVRSLLRRVNAQNQSADILSFSGLTIDATRHEVSADGKLVELTATEFRILRMLASREGRVFSRGEIVDAICGHDNSIMDRTIDVHVMSIRRKLGRCGEYVRTIRGTGYKFDPRVAAEAVAVGAGEQVRL